MNAEIICIGTELLLGHVLNTNQAYLARELAQIGINVYYHSTVGDNPGRLTEVITTALARSDIIILTGGLGPTIDDITMQTVADTLGLKRVVNTPLLIHIKKILKKRHLPLLKSTLFQASLPKHASIIPNPSGTAPGLIIEVKKRQYLICLPGVPFEMQAMCPAVTAFIKKIPIHLPSCIVTKTLNITGITEPQVDNRIKDLLTMTGDVTAGIYCSPGKIEVTITAKARTKNTAFKKILPWRKILCERLGHYIYSEDTTTLEEVVGKLLRNHKNTLSIAESCTGGLITDRITNVPGSSAYFLCGVNTYSNNAKITLLKISTKTLKQYGAVSHQIAREMAHGIHHITGSDYSLASTGICGPDGATYKKPIGLVYIACYSKKTTIVKKYLFSGSRIQIKYKASQAALDLLRQMLLEDKNIRK